MEKGLSQEALALESGLSRNMMIGIEWGRKSVAYERLWDIADVLGVELEDLLLPPRSVAQRRPTLAQERERRRQKFTGSSRIQPQPPWRRKQQVQ